MLLTLEALKEFKEDAEIESGSKIKMLRCDNGGDFTPEVFDNLCKQHGNKDNWLLILHRKMVLLRE